MKGGQLPALCNALSVEQRKESRSLKYHKNYGIAEEEKSQIIGPQTLGTKMPFFR